MAMLKPGERFVAALATLIALMFVMSCASGGGPQKPPDPLPPGAQKAALHVFARDAATGAPIPNARVDVNFLAGEDDGRTNEDGYWGVQAELLPPCVPDIHCDSYRLEVHAEGYHSAGVDVFFRGELETIVALEVLPPPPPPIVRRTGIVRIDGNSLVDDQGVWFAEGVTLMPAIALVHRFPDRAAAACELHQQGIDVARILAVVGGEEFPVGDGTRADPWEHLAADPRDPAWAARLAATTDYFYDQCGIRSAWTLFGGIAYATTLGEQQRVVRIWLETMRPRLHKVAWVELANEMWQTGFGGDAGIARARQLTRQLADGLPPHFPVAMSTARATPEDLDPTEELRAMFEGSAANLYTPHFSRRTDTVDGAHRAVRQPWEWSAVYSLRAAIDNERIGPGSSVASERNTSRIVAGWVTTRIARLTGYHLHTDAGVWACAIHSAFLGGHEDRLRGTYCTVQTEPGAAAALASMQQLRNVLPADMHTWQRTRHGLPDHPFGASFQRRGDHFTQIWPDGHTAHGVVRAYCSVDGNRFVCLMSGIRDRIELAWQHALEATVFSARTGDPVATIGALDRARTLRESTDTDQIIVGRYR